MNLSDSEELFFENGGSQVHPRKAGDDGDGPGSGSGYRILGEVEKVSGMAVQKFLLFFLKKEKRVDVFS